MLQGLRHHSKREREECIHIVQLHVHGSWVKGTDTDVQLGGNLEGILLDTVWFAETHLLDVRLNIDYRFK